MSTTNRATRETQPLEVHLVGIHLGHSITPPLSKYTCQSLDLPWTVHGTECPTIEDCVKTFRSPNFAGGIVTMPWKGEIMRYVDRLDETAKTLNACNAVYLDDEGKLCGTNTDWVGIEGAIRAVGKTTSSKQSSQSRAGLIIGAGGAARAAVYTLTRCFGVEEVYVLNRDVEEVEQLFRDCSGMGGNEAVSIVHVRSLEQAAELRTPSYVIGSVPDVEPVTREEKSVKEILASFLARDGEKGVALDMCYRPCWTRHLQLAKEHGWRPAFGMDVVGHQAEALWGLWITKERLSRLDREGMFKELDAISAKVE